jgi:death on curing protein
VSETFFPKPDEILSIHSEIIAATGGSTGLRDAGALESALKAAENRFFYETDNLAILGATYAYHLSQHTLLLTATSESRRLSLNCFWK